MKLRDRAIRIMRASRQTHVLWLEWQLETPDWRDHVTPDAPGDPEHHRRCIDEYDVVLRALRRLP